MTTIIKVTFHIIDNEFESEYDYDTVFLKESEFLMFIRENLEAGNRIEVLSLEKETPLKKSRKNFISIFKKGVDKSLKVW